MCFASLRWWPVSARSCCPRGRPPTIASTPPPPAPSTTTPTRATTTNWRGAAARARAAPRCPRHCPQPFRPPTWVSTTKLSLRKSSPSRRRCRSTKRTPRTGASPCCTARTRRAICATWAPGCRCSAPSISTSGRWAAAGRICCRAWTSRRRSSAPGLCQARSPHCHPGIPPWIWIAFFSTRLLLLVRVFI